MLYSFRVAIHPLDRSASTGPAIAMGDRQVATLAPTAEALRTPHRVTFDRCAEMLQGLPRMFFEPDGSFVWTGIEQGEAWQVDGVLYDQGPQLAYAEIVGRCPPDEFDQLLAAFGWPAAPLMFQLTAAGVFLSEADFRRACVA